MKKLCLALLLLITLSVRAQYVGLKDKEVESLKEFISKDADANKMYQQYLGLARESITLHPNPIDTIRTEGLLKGNPKKIATAASLRDMGRMYALAVAYRVNGENQFLRTLTAYLTAWAEVNIGRGDPIDDTNLEQAIEAYDLVKRELTPAVNASVVKWFQQTADAEISMHQKGLSKTSAYNNWNSHRLKIVAMIAYTINDQKYMKYVTEDLSRHLPHNLNADGSSVDFKLRDALHYHAYDLEPLLRMAIVLKRATGSDEYRTVTASGASLKKSTAWFVPYVTGEKTHEEFVHSTVDFDLKRAQNGEGDYKAGTLFNPKNGYKTLTLAAYFDPAYSTILKEVKGSNNSYSEWQLVLNKVMK